ncbi:MAG: hypothetical protein ABEH43_11315 [Flavobacteriales bacterium]
MDKLDITKLHFEILKEEGYDLTDNDKLYAMSKFFDNLKTLKERLEKDQIKDIADDTQKEKEENIEERLKSNFYKKAEASRIVGVSRPTLNKWLKKGTYDIQTKLQAGKEFIPRKEVIRLFKLLNE